MKRLKQFGAAWLAFVILFVACTPTVTSQPATATFAPVPSDTAAPTLVTYNLSGPISGSTMTWMDGGTLVYIPAGEFAMGAQEADNPRHGVSLSPYWIHKTKVTNRMYALCVGVGVCSAPKPVPGAAVYTDPTYSDHPVVGVDWERANAYCGWAGGRLPTEAEWEKAARGLSAPTYPWGEANPACELANVGGCESTTTSVVAHPRGASAFGLLDIAGNVFEWTWDWYDSTYYATSPIQDPPGPAEGIYKVIRGSSFESEFSQAPSALRHYGGPTYTSHDLGFRCAVQQPINFPPYCQSTPYQPTNNAPVVSSCGAPEFTQYEPYCDGSTPYASLDLPLGTTYTVDTPGYSCIETLTNGILRLNCTGPDNSSGTLTVCNTACADPTPSLTQGVVCDPGYSYDSATRQCVYAPLAAQAGPQGCPPGYVLDSAGQVCRPTAGLDNQCPLGQYFDAALNACAPANGQAACNVYGLDNPSLALSCYLGCPAGYSFDSNTQCCSAPALGLYPSCQPGFAYDPVVGACVSGLAAAAGAGCTTVSLNQLQCGQPYDCGQYVQEAVCIRNAVFGCTWDDQVNVCVNKK